MVKVPHYLHGHNTVFQIDFIKAPYPILPVNILLTYTRKSDLKNVIQDTGEIITQQLVRDNLLNIRSSLMVMVVKQSISNYT